MSTILEVTPVASSRLAPERRRQLVRRAKRLAWGGLVWHVAEFAIAIGAGLAASSIALIGFGADSLIEAIAGLIVLWRFAAPRASSEQAERRAQRLIAISFFVLGAYITLEALHTLLAAQHPSASWVGIALAAVTAPTMPLLARAKRRVGQQLGSQATISEGAQNMLCAYLSITLLAGLGSNALLGWWWADPITALVIAAIASKEGIEAWQGDGCACCAPLVPGEVQTTSNGADAGASSPARGGAANGEDAAP